MTREREFYPRSQTFRKQRSNTTQDWGSQVEPSTIRPIVQVSRSPVLNGVQPSWFEMMVEQVPKRHFRYVSNVRCIVYDDVESFWSNRTSNLGEKCWILLSALEYLNPVFRSEVLGKLTIDSNDSTSREILAP